MGAPLLVWIDFIPCLIPLLHMSFRALDTTLLHVTDGMIEGS